MEAPTRASVVLIPNCLCPCGRDAKAPPGTSEASFPWLSSFGRSGWKAPSLSFSLILSLCFSLSPALWPTRPLITLGKSYRLGSTLPPKLLACSALTVGRRHRLINLSGQTWARAAQHEPLSQISLLLPSCSPPAPVTGTPGPAQSQPDPREVGGDSPPQRPGGRAGGPVSGPQLPSQGLHLRGPTPPATKEPGALMGLHILLRITGDLLGAGS